MYCLHRIISKKKKKMKFCEQCNFDKFVKKNFAKMNHILAN